MPNTKIVTAIGDIDGVNLKFYTGEPYVAGFTRYILNGRIHPAVDDDFSFTESNPDAGEITVTVAPEDGDVVQIFFIDRRPAVIADVQQLEGSIRKAPIQLAGSLQKPPTAQLEGAVNKKKLTGVVVARLPTQLRGTVAPKPLSGVLRKVC